MEQLKNEKGWKIALYTILFSLKMTQTEKVLLIFGAGGNNVIGIVSANNNPDNYQLICHPHFSECNQILLSLDGYYFIYYKRYYVISSLRTLFPAGQQLC